MNRYLVIAGVIVLILVLAFVFIGMRTKAQVAQGQVPDTVYAQPSPVYPSPQLPGATTNVFTPSAASQDDGVNTCEAWEIKEVRKSCAQLAKTECKSTPLLKRGKCKRKQAGLCTDKLMAERC